MLPLITLRLQNQLLVRPPFDSPQQVVEWMGAIQAQDYRMAKWAVGCRTASTDATQIEAALNRGDILRTHLLRPTWHFVSSKDLRWMLSLTADRIRTANESFARGTDAEKAALGIVDGMKLAGVHDATKTYLAYHRAHVFVDRKN